jgi:hypothetical protein
MIEVRTASDNVMDRPPRDSLWAEVIPAFANVHPRPRASVWGVRRARAAPCARRLRTGLAGHERPGLRV